jgi:hypothetical protein
VARRGAKLNAHNVAVGNLSEKDDLEDLGVDGG